MKIQPKQKAQCAFLWGKKKKSKTKPNQPTPTERMLYLEGSGSWSVAFYQRLTTERASGSAQKWTHYSCREQVPAATPGLLPTLQSSLPAPTALLISYCLLGLLCCLASSEWSLSLPNRERGTGVVWIFSFASCPETSETWKHRENSESSS